MQYCEMCWRNQDDLECDMPSGSRECTAPTGTSDGWATEERPPSTTATTFTSPSGSQYLAGFGLLLLLVFMFWGALFVTVLTAWSMMETLLGGR